MDFWGCVPCRRLERSCVCVSVRRRRKSNYANNSTCHTQLYDHRVDISKHTGVNTRIFVLFRAPLEQWWWCETTPEWRCRCVCYARLFGSMSRRPKLSALQRYLIVPLSRKRQSPRRPKHTEKKHRTSVQTKTNSNKVRRLRGCVGVCVRVTFCLGGTTTETRHRQRPPRARILHQNTPRIGFTCELLSKKKQRQNPTVLVMKKGVFLAFGDPFQYFISNAITY